MDMSSLTAPEEFSDKSPAMPSLLNLFETVAKSYTSKELMDNFGIAGSEFLETLNALRTPEPAPEIIERAKRFRKDLISKGLAMIVAKSSYNQVPLTPRIHRGPKGEWVLEVKGDHTKGDCEVSAVIKGTHGQLSWGWNDPNNKIIVLSCSSVYMNYVDPRIVEAAKAVAMEIVNEKNASKEKDND